MPWLSVPDGRSVSVGTKGRKLTPKMVEWIDLYMEHKSGPKASELSSYQTINPSRHSAQLLQHPLIREEIAKRQERLTEKREKVSEIKAEYLINKLISIIDSDEIKTADTLRAIELAGKSIALWKERQEISGPDGDAIRHEQHIKESVADFTSRISGLVKRNGTDNVVEFPERNGAGGT